MIHLYYIRPKDVSLSKDLLWHRASSTLYSRDCDRASAGQQTSGFKLGSIIEKSWKNKKGKKITNQLNVRKRRKKWIDCKTRVEIQENIDIDLFS